MPSKEYGKIKRGKDVDAGDRVYHAKEYLLKPIKGRRVIVAGDNSEPEILGENLRDLDLLIHECTYTKKVFENLKVKVLHTTAFDIGKTAEKYGVKKLALTHISPRFNDEGKYPLSLIEDEVRQNYKGELIMAKDFLEINLKRDDM
jgi:ribonuclease Z